MSAADLIFWYTGAIAWAVVSVAVLIAFLAGIVMAFRYGREWDALRTLCGKSERMTLAERERIVNAIWFANNKVDHPFGTSGRIKFMRWLVEYRKAYHHKRKPL